MTQNEKKIIPEPRSNQK